MSGLHNENDVIDLGLGLAFFRSMVGAKLVECAPKEQFSVKSWTGFTANNFAVALTATMATIVFVTSLVGTSSWLWRSRKLLTGIAWLTSKSACARVTINSTGWVFVRPSPIGTLADANRERDWRIYHDLAQGLIAAQRLYAHEPLGVELEQTVYALDSTTIDLCLSLFPLGALSFHRSGRQTAHALGLRGLFRP